MNEEFVQRSLELQQDEGDSDAACNFELDKDMEINEDVFKSNIKTEIDCHICLDVIRPSDRCARSRHWGCKCITHFKCALKSIKHKSAKPVRPYPAASLISCYGKTQIIKIM